MLIKTNWETKPFARDHKFRYWRLTAGKVTLFTLEKDLELNWFNVVPRLNNWQGFSSAKLALRFIRRELGVTARREPRAVKFNAPLLRLPNSDELREMKEASQ